MKKVLLLAAACLLTLGVSAQSLVKPWSDAAGAIKSSRVSAKANGAVNKAPSKALEANQYYCGLYTSDEIAEYGSGMAYAGISRTATIFGSDVYGSYVGFKVVGMRVALCADVTDFGVFVATSSTSSIDDKLVKTIGKGSQGWNTVMFEESEQFEIPSDDTEFITGYIYMQNNTPDPNYPGYMTDDCYSMSILSNQEKSNVILWYGNIPATQGGSGLGWYQIGTGTLSVQWIVEGELPGQKLIIGSFGPQKNFFAKDEEVTWAMDVTNMGSNTVSSVDVDIQLDGSPLTSTTIPTTLASTGKKTLTSSFALPSDITVGSHTFQVKVTGVDGATPTGEIVGNEKTAAFKVYVESVARQKQLIEHITSWTCTYCYLGYNVLRKMETDYDDIAWVAVHGNQSSQTDPYYFAACNQIISNLNSGSFPSAAFNRSFISELADGDATLAYGLGYNASYLNQVVPYLRGFIDAASANNPSFVTLDIAQEFDVDSRVLNITVNGTGVEQAAQLLSDCGMNIYITEEGLTGRQYSSGSWQNDFEHNNTLRAVLTSPNGDDISWSGDNFSFTASYTIPDSYVVENLSITAFVAPHPGDIYNMTVNNCERVAVETAATGISLVRDEQAVPAEYYTLDGRQLSAPQPGLNVVRMSDGTSRKVVIR